ncbi:MAG: cation transporter [Verrucomicrobia bacterium]|nr:cation transporter [Verrucomicrobiota bacterium]
MSHECHEHAHHHALHRSLWIAVIFMIVEIVGGWVANSLALISDAMHLFTDVGALLLGIIVARMARWPTTPIMSYGYHRAEILGALVSAASLWALSGVLIYESIHRFFQPEIVDGPIVFFIASIGLIANLWMMKILHPSQHHSLNMRAAYLHVLGDLLGSLGVIISGIILWSTHWNLIDPLITILFTLTILRSSGKVIKQTIGILMESAPEGIDPTAVQKTLEQISGVEEVHDLHIWSASHHKVVLSVHLVANPQSDILAEAHRRLEADFGIRHMTIQVEHPKSFEPKYCYDCENKL